ncbi:MAG: exo-alpha-sialidase [Verrucomicrobia bacterium]|nr:MAG: exo-alpha-sialidase [Verrucomicrobiota bacterium]
MRANYALTALALTLLTTAQVGCRQKSEASSGVWSKPVEIAKSSDSLSTSFSLYRWNGTLLTLGGDSGTFAARVLEDNGQDWRTVSSADPGWIPLDADAKESRFVIARDTIWRDKLEATFSVVSLSADGRFTKGNTASLHFQKDALFPGAPSNLELHPWDGQGHGAFWGGTLNGEEIRLPFCIEGTPIERTGHQVGVRADLALSANGVFASSDGGRTWRTEAISVREARAPVLCRTKGYYYYFAKSYYGSFYESWFSRRSTEDGSWSHPETLNKSVAVKLSENLHALGEGDTAHLCWLDSRHEKTRLSLNRPLAENYEVAYSRRKDSEASWSKDIILSKGLRWAYAPSMAAEGNNLVVAWAGARGLADRTEFGPSDIYYVTSDDSGKTWTKPTQVTDGFKSEITAGRPQVALHKGVIHLLYVQGKLNFKKSGGLVKLNQPPWPILYQQRPFPSANP